MNNAARRQALADAARAGLILGALGASACGAERSQSQPAEAPAQVIVAPATALDSDAPGAEENMAAPVRVVSGPDPERQSEDCCKGMNECKGLGNCATDANDCKGKNECKGQGGCRAHCPN